MEIEFAKVENFDRQLVARRMRGAQWSASCQIRSLGLYCACNWNP